MIKLFNRLKEFIVMLFLNIINVLMSCSKISDEEMNLFLNEILENKKYEFKDVIDVTSNLQNIILEEGNKKYISYRPNVYGTNFRFLSSLQDMTCRTDRIYLFQGYLIKKYNNNILDTKLGLLEDLISELFYREFYLEHGAYLSDPKIEILLSNQTAVNAKLAYEKFVEKYKMDLYKLALFSRKQNIKEVLTE